MKELMVVAFVVKNKKLSADLRLEMEKQQRNQVENLAEAGCLSDDAKAGITPAPEIVPCPPPPPPLCIGSLNDKPLNLSRVMSKNIPQPSNPLKSFNWCKLPELLKFMPSHEEKVLLEEHSIEIDNMS
nr:uncharacterized protein LOC107441556 isoform X2 [Parasteatoda tepidariorum]